MAAANTTEGSTDVPGSRDFIRFNDVEKITLTLAVVFSVLIIASSIAFFIWCTSSRKQPKKVIRHRLVRSASRSSEAIEKELRGLDFVDPSYLSQINLSGDSASDDLSVAAQRLPSSSPQYKRPANKVPIKPTRTKSDAQNQNLSYTATPGPSGTAVLDRQVVNESTSNTAQSELPGTHIYSISSHKTTDRLSSSTNRNSSNVEPRIEPSYLKGGLIWPDVCDPYHKSLELQLKIGDKLTSM